MSVQPTYPSAPTPQQGAIIGPALKPTLYKRNPIGAPRQYSLQGGIRWRDLPRDQPPWQGVSYHFRR